jgi:hypothetical protein
MPRYFFNVRNGHHCMPDLEGEEFADVAEVHQRAWWTAKAMLSRPSTYTAPWQNAVFEVTDETRKLVLKLAFANVRGTRPPPLAIIGWISLLPVVLAIAA